MDIIHVYVKNEEELDISEDEDKKNTHRITLRVDEDKIEKDRYTVKAGIITLDRGLIVLVTDSEFTFGNMAVAMPMTTVPTTSSIIFPAIGGKGEFAARFLAEQIANITSQQLVIFVNFKEYTQDRIVTSLELIKKMVNKLNLTKNSVHPKREVK